MIDESAPQGLRKPAWPRLALLSFLVLPLVLIRLPGRVFAARKRNAARAAEIRAVTSALKAPLWGVSDEVALQDDLRGTFADLARAGDWAQIHQRLRAMDQAHDALPGGKRHWRCALDGALEPLSAALQARDLAAVQAVLHGCDQRAADHPHDYCATVIAAQAHMDHGWARRDGLVQDVAAADLALFQAETARAETLLEVFDPIEEMSAMLAATRYQLIRGIKGGGALCRDFYADLVDLDPGDVDAHQDHAFHVLPQWYGKASQFDREARKAAAATTQELGAAVYALFYAQAAMGAQTLLRDMDADYVVAGWRDYRAAAPGAHRGNIAAGELARAVQIAQALDLDAATQSALQAGLSDVLRDGVHRLEPRLWPSRDALPLALARAFGAEIAQGARLVQGKTGLLVQLPAA